MPCVFYKLRSALQLSDDPRHQQPNNAVLLFLSQFNTPGNVVPSFQTPSAAAGAGMLGNKNGVSPHGSLFSVVGNDCRGKACPHKILCVLPNDRESFFGNVSLVLGAQVKFCSKIGALQSLQSLLNGHAEPLSPHGVENFRLWQQSETYPQNRSGVSAEYPVGVASGFILSDHKLIVDFMFQLCNMRDNANQLGAAGHFL